MKITDNLKSIISKQKDLISELENEYQLISSQDLTKENEKLKTELEKIKADYLSTKEKLKQISDQNSALKNSLYEQIYNEKLNILKISQNKLDVFFKADHNVQLNRLTSFENSTKEKLRAMAKTLQESNVTLKDEIYTQLNDLSVLLNQKVTAAREQSNKQLNSLSEQSKLEYQKLKDEQITDEVILNSTKKNNFESFIGLNLINKLGILLIFIGVIAASQYTYRFFDNLTRGILLFGLGAVLLIVGELLNHKKANIFSLGISAAGVGVSYIALATSFFVLKIFGSEPMLPAIAICITITVIAFALAIRYNAQVILAFALIGGYLPIFTAMSDKTTVFSFMGYFLVLNLLALLVSYRKKWTVSTYVGLLLNIAGIIHINSSFQYSDLSGKIISIVYLFLAFLVYTLIPIISTSKQAQKFSEADIFLIGLNTFFSSIIINVQFSAFGFGKYQGLFAAIFAIIYFAVGKYIEFKFSSDKYTRFLFYITSLTFVVLIVSFQFDVKWWSLGWLIEGVLLATFGIIKKLPGYRKSGLIIYGLCVITFLAVDCVFLRNEIFSYKYFAITAGSIVILGSLAFAKTLSNAFEKTFKYLSMVNLVFYCGYLSNLIFDTFVPDKNWNDLYLKQALFITFIFALGYVVPRIKILYDEGVKTISYVLYALGFIELIVLNSNSQILTKSIYKVGIEHQIISTSIIIALSLLSLFVLYDFLKRLIIESTLKVEWLPIITSGYFLVILTQNLVVKYNLAFTNAAISIIYVLAALAWIIFGFYRRYTYIRRFGLSLALLSVIKLFLLDLISLTQGYHILLYFSLGVSLLAISFIYQYFSKRLELNVKITSKIENDT